MNVSAFLKNKVLADTDFTVDFGDNSHLIYIVSIKDEL